MPSWQFSVLSLSKAAYFKSMLHRRRIARHGDHMHIRISATGLQPFELQSQKKAGFDSIRRPILPCHLLSPRKSVLPTTTGVPTPTFPPVNSSPRTLTMAHKIGFFWDGSIFNEGLNQGISGNGLAFTELKSL